MKLTHSIELAGYRVPAMLQNKASITPSARDDDRVVIIPLDELWGKTPDECKIIIERYLESQQFRKTGEG